MGKDELYQVADCVGRATLELCETAFQAGEVDVLTDVDMGELYSLNSEITSIRVVGEEVHPNFAGVTGYYGIAVTWATNCEAGGPFEAGWASPTPGLQMLATCHTGYQKTAGWRLPVGTLLDRGIIPIVPAGGALPNDVASMETFFKGGSCAPVKPAYDYLKTSPICSKCGGTGDDFCSQVAGEPYQNYPGSLRGLVEGACGVAMVRHRTPLRYTDAAATYPEIPGAGDKYAAGDTDDWAWNGMESVTNYKLVCKTGCAEIGNYADPDCTFGRAVGHTTIINTATVASNVPLDLSTALQAADLGPAFATDLIFEAGASEMSFAGLALPHEFATEAFAAFDELEEVNAIEKCIGPDVNFDGALNVVDVVSIISCLIGRTTEAWCYGT